MAGTDVHGVDPDARASGSRLLAWTRRVPTPPAVTWARFLEVLWIDGAGFGPRPVIEHRGDPDGRGCTRRIPIGRSGGVVERIVATEHPNELAYQVVNPSWRTFPVEHHLGTVAFVALDDGGTEVRWRVELVAKHGAGLLVAGFTRFVIGRYLDVLARRCRDAAAAPPAVPGG